MGFDDPPPPYYSVVKDHSVKKDYSDPPPPYCCPHSVPTVKKKQYAWVWPRGGRKQGKRAMAKDILSNKGPAIYIAANHFGKAATVRDGPSRSLWSGWGDQIDYTCNNRHLDSESYSHGDLGSSKRVDTKKRYDYRSRKYKYPQPGDLKSMSHYKDRYGERYVAESRMYRGKNELDLVMKVHPLAETRYLDPRNFHDHFIGGMGGAGGWWTREMSGWEDEYWDRYSPYDSPVHGRTAYY